MKKLLLASVLLFTGSQLMAQCSDLFISEYVEGSHNNKAIEIYNPTNNAIFLNNEYRIVRWDNGLTNSDQNTVKWINLGDDTLWSGQAYVIVIDKRDPNATGQDTAVFAALQAKANIFLCPDYNTNNAMYFNGDDAVSLQKYNGTSWVNIDIFGVIGERPTNGNGTYSPTGGWTATPDYWDGQGTYWSRDHSLIRKATVLQGRTNPGVALNSPGDFNPQTEWDSLPENTFSNLGMHTCACNPQSLSELGNNLSISVYPNPANGEAITIETNDNITTVEVYNMVGQVVSATRENEANRAMIETASLAKGVYVVKVSLKTSGIYFTRISIQ